MSKRAREDEIVAEMHQHPPLGVNVKWYPAGEEPDSFTPGDFSLHRATTTKGRDGKTTVIGKLIEAGERARYGRSNFARWTHSTLIVSDSGDICEAIACGVEENNIEKYRDSDYMVVHLSASAEQRDLACGFAESRKGRKYDTLDFVALAFQAVFGWTLSIHSDGRFTCAGLVSRATEKYIDGYPRSPEDMMPGDLAWYWDAESGRKPEPALGFFGRALNLLLTVGSLLSGAHGDPAPELGPSATTHSIPRSAQSDELKSPSVPKAA